MATFGGNDDEPPVKLVDAPGRYKLSPALSISGLPAEVFSLRYSPDGKYLAAACGDGVIRVFNASTGKLSQTLNAPEESGGLPATICRFRPFDTDRSKNVLLVGNANGALQHWHITSGKCLHSMVDDENQYYALDYMPNGSKFAAAGKKPVIQLFDEDTRKELCILEGSRGFGYSTKGSESHAGHSNRIFSLKFNPLDPNILISGGWDNTVHLWDVRSEQSVRTMYGPHICGDSIDVNGNNLLTGSWKPVDQVQLWDLGSGNLIKTIDWGSSSYIHQREPLMVYAAQFNKTTYDKPKAQFIAAGGSGANEARVFDVQDDFNLVGTVTGLNRGVFTLDFAPNDFRIAVAGGDATIRVLDIIDS